MQERYVRQLEKQYEYLEEELRIANAMIEELENLVGDVDKALMEAWALMTPEARKKLLDNEYAEDFFWNEPECLERRGL